MPPKKEEKKDFCLTRKVEINVESLSDEKRN